MSDPRYLGVALQPPNTDLDLLAQNAANASATATQASADATLALEARIAVPNPAQGRLESLLQDYINNTNTFWVKSFGVVGDGVHDDTAAMQVALNAAAAANRVLYAGDAVIKVTGPLTLNGPGLVFDKSSYGLSGEPGIYASGTAFGATPVLTVTGMTSALCVSVYGTGQTANAIYLNNPQRSTISAIRAYNFDGFGVKIDRCFDCLFGTISVELCGNATNYAFSMNDAGDSCNMTHITRLQVEAANQLAIYLGGLCLSITIDDIHSEGLRNPNPAVFAWELNGGSCSFNASRFTSTGTVANARLFVRGANTDYTALRSEGCTAFLEGGGGAPITLISPTFGGGVVQEYPGQAGALIIVGGDYGSWTGPTGHRYVIGAGSSYLPTSGGNLTGDLVLESSAGVTGSTRFRKATAYKGTALSSGDTGALGTGGIVDLADGNTVAILLIVSDGGDGAMALIEGGLGNVAVTALGGSPWSTAQGTASSSNVYWDSGSGTYRLENQNGATRTYYVFKVGRVPSA